jgi:hypothetical protein
MTWMMSRSSSSPPLPPFFYRVSFVFSTTVMNSLKSHHEVDCVFPWILGKSGGDSSGSG